MTVFEYNTPFVIVQVNGMLQKPRITKNGIKVMCQAGYIECDQTLICLALDTYFACPNHRTGLTIRHADLDMPTCSQTANAFLQTPGRATLKPALKSTRQVYNQFGALSCMTSLLLAIALSD